MSKSKFVLTQIGNTTFAPAQLVTAPTVDKLPGGVYDIELGEKGITFNFVEYYFKETTQLFGSRIKERISNILESWAEDGNSVNALAIGDKGSGKTLMAKTIFNSLIKSEGMAVFRVTKALPPAVLEHIVSVVPDCGFFFDEFDSIYVHIRGEEEYADETLLSFFSDNRENRSLSILTANEANLVSKYMMDRPGRIKYRCYFGKLTAEEANDALAKWGFRQVINEYLVNYATQTTNVTFDILSHVSKLMDKCITRGYNGVDMDLSSEEQDAFADKKALESFNLLLRDINAPLPSYIKKVVSIRTTGGIDDVLEIITGERKGIAEITLRNKVDKLNPYTINETQAWQYDEDTPDGKVSHRAAFRFSEERDTIGEAAYPLVCYKIDKDGLKYEVHSLSDGTFVAIDE